MAAYRLAVWLHVGGDLPAFRSGNLDFLAGCGVEGVVGCGKDFDHFDGLDDFVMVVDVVVTGDCFVLDVFHIVKDSLLGDGGFDLGRDVGVD